MTGEPVTKETLLANAQAMLHWDVRAYMADQVAIFLLSLQDTEPDFSLIGLSNALTRFRLSSGKYQLGKTERAKSQKNMAQRKKLESMFI